MKETLKILKKSLKELIKGNTFQKEQICVMLLELLKLEKLIIKIQVEVEGSQPILDKASMGEL